MSGIRFKQINNKILHEANVFNQFTFLTNIIHRHGLFVKIYKVTSSDNKVIFSVITKG